MSTVYFVVKSLAVFVRICILYINSLTLLVFHGSTKLKVELVERSLMTVSTVCHCLHRLFY